MSNTETNKYQAAAHLLGATADQIAVLLADPADELHKLRLMQNLKREADYILLITGSGDLQTGKATVLGPAKTIAGVPIGKQRTFTEADLVPADDKVFNLKQQVESAVEYFGPDADSAGILANIPEIVIRGVAKKAGFKEVTRDNPKEITVEFIDQIKAALHPVKGEPLEPADETGESKEAKAPTSETEPPIDEKVANYDASLGKAPDNQPKPDNKKGKSGK